MWQLWTALGWNDVRLRYRRSVLGPFWLTCSMGVMIGTIGFVYANLFDLPASSYLPYLGLGFIVWGLLSTILQESCSAFTGSDGIIRQVRVPHPVHVFRILWRNFIVFFHNLLIYVAIVVIFKIPVGSVTLLVVPALALIWANGVWLGLLLGALSARFRDVQQIVLNVIQIFFYVTPIVWTVEQLPQHSAIITYNPFFYFVDIVRSPLLGTAPGASTWIVVAAGAALGNAVCLAVWPRIRGRIAYWI